ncbi:hypothetical protein [Neobacillus sp. OS1-33]|uniref:hypothetical protein n=1 Tax=Neobacillus sp. OS1-33 TaxID=3070683 RepID=UPI0027E0C683|nr:hypothetical protein [Neobacillus sp. OS1-33]WML26270.1 hypothetical protein RCG22_01080 [Neobacillus sp. OS1-33]
MQKYTYELLQLSGKVRKVKLGLFFTCLILHGNVEAIKRSRKELRKEWTEEKEIY